MTNFLYSLSQWSQVFLFFGTKNVITNTSTTANTWVSIVGWEGKLRSPNKQQGIPHLFFRVCTHRIFVSVIKNMDKILILNVYKSRNDVGYMRTLYYLYNFSVNVKTLENKKSLNKHGVHLKLI